ncbi:unnamed protein product [Zymoseptoria tritici ST99CH_1E4]|uniref:Uncharacterized protein n=1 Tax=Zymoseptoria tritici ST99CH_1E4 TaxID=1276532 RepID=A0A2H1FZQ0_ZYMTR|nr:unnamed protein product [Zymoseptoria tritici ST99CH_1E4]
MKNVARGSCSQHSHWFREPFTDVYSGPGAQVAITVFGRDESKLSPEFVEFRSTCGHRCLGQRWIQIERALKLREALDAFVQLEVNKWTAYENAYDHKNSYKPVN